MVRPDPFIGKVIDGRYQLVDRIGAGGFGAVYKAEHQRLGSPFAIKFMFAMLAQDESMVARFEREAKTTSLLHHPHIVDVVDFGDEPALGLYLVMEYLVGETLRQRIRRDGAQDAATIVRIADPICQALVTAHERGVIHRDLKPPNIFLVRTDVRDDFVKILDFGIAGLTDDGGKSLTKTGMVMGSPPYMSPEQAWARKLDHRTDIYSLGVILYEMATGSTPFRAESDVAILDAHRSTTPVPPRRFRPDLDIPPGLEKLILRCLAKAPEDRYQSIQAIRRELGTLSVELGVSGLTEIPAWSPEEAKDEGATTIIPATAPVPRTPVVVDTVPANHAEATPVAESDAATTAPAADADESPSPPPVVPTSTLRPRRRATLIAAVAALAVVAVLLIVVLPDRPSTAGAAAPAEAAAPTEAAAPAEAAEESVPDTSAENASAPVAVSPAPDAAAPVEADAGAVGEAPDVIVPAPAPRPAHLVLRTEPRGARVFRDATELCVTPCDLELEAVGRDVTLRIERDGYLEKTIDVTLVEGADIDREVRLERERRRKKTKKRPKAKESVRESPGDLPGIRVDSTKKKPTEAPAPLPKLRVE